MNIIKKENINGIYRLLSIVALQVVIVLSAYSQSNILDDLQRADGNTEATVIVYQDSTITDALLRQQPVTTQSNSNLSRGWSVQVFSDNSISARDIAFQIENKVKERMPNEYVRAERHAPFWKVRVGQFESAEEAQALKNVLLQEFPEFRGGIYVVKFNTSND
ncbi:MAG: SPOR domain-containing protein [Bacteroidetes bacterium]|nr:MAG: SPOR domain-containing protein [Bacteroidota bacterium]